MCKGERDRSLARGGEWLFDLSTPPMPAKVLVRFIVILSFAVVLTACAGRKPKSSSRIYEGDSPSLRFSSERETAGGALGR